MKKILKNLLKFNFTYKQMFVKMYLGDYMKINKITKLKNGKYKIILDNEVITTYDEIILKENLLYKKDIDTEKLKQIKKQTDIYDIYNKVVILISKRYRSKYEIEKYLDNNINDEEKENILNKLINNNLINDERYVKSYIYDKVNLSKDGPLLIKKDLLKHNIDENIINKYIEEIDKKIIYEKLKKQIITKINLNKSSKINLYNKILITYKEKGYDINMIKEIFNQNYKENKTNYIKEYNKIKNKLEKKYTGYELEYKIKQKLYQKGYNNIDL